MFNEFSYLQLQLKIKLLERSDKKFRTKSWHSKLAKNNIGIHSGSLICVLSLLMGATNMFSKETQLTIIAYASVIVFVVFVLVPFCKTTSFDFQKALITVELERRDRIKEHICFLSPTTQTLKQQEQILAEYSIFPKNESTLEKLLAMRL